MSRFPSDFPQTCLPGHALYNEVIEYIPVVDPGSVGSRVRAADPVLVTNPDHTVVGDMGLFDWDSDAEEEEILLMDELVPEDEGSADDAVPIVSTERRKSRYGYSLEGCDCERPRGRKCLCEKRDDGL